MRQLYRDPTLHFLVVGAAIFGLHAWVGPRVEETTSVEGEIEVSRVTVRQLENDYTRRTGNTPDAAARHDVIRQYIIEEVLYREALALGLERGDPIVRRRLVQVMEFLTEDTLVTPNPTEDEISEYYEANREDFYQPPRISLDHVFFSRDRHGDRAEAEASALLPTLQAGVDHHGLGDPFIRGNRVPPTTQQRLSSIYGNRFAQTVFAFDEASQPAEASEYTEASESTEASTVGWWFGPVSSAFGFHLVRIIDRESERHPSLEEMRSEATLQVIDALRERANREAYETMLGRYSVTVEGVPFELEVAEVEGAGRGTQAQ